MMKKQLIGTLSYGVLKGHDKMSEWTKALEEVARYYEKVVKRAAEVAEQAKKEAEVASKQK